MHQDTEACYRAVKSKDRRFDGVFYTAVRTTGIYCRPSCPAITPKLANVTFHPSAAAAQLAGYRACKRCLPDATPGSPEWDLAADVAGRAMRLISDGIVDRDGVDGLAARLGYSTRQLNRVVSSSFGAGPLALARARRSQTARVLIETTELSFADVAFASGFASIRQFNDTVREVYAATPTELRGRRGRTSASGSIVTRIGVREPFAGTELLGFLALRAVPGIEAVDLEAGWYERSLDLPHGPGVVRIDLRDRPAGQVPCRFALADARDLAPALERTRRLLDADADPIAVDEQLGDDPRLAPLVRRRPGLRVPGHVDGFEVAVRAVLGQQVSVAGARTLAARLVDSHGRELDLAGQHQVTSLFPAADALAGIDPEEIAMPRARGRALAAMAAAVADGTVALDRSADRGEVRDSLLAVPGIGPWTADYIALRALGDPDVFLPTDLGVKHAAEHLGIDDIARHSEGWRPWRSYALIHLWSGLSGQTNKES
ncbi:DNA-3-methyladenine glycosylase 2 family protein [Nocardioides marmoriginsengisoli]|uniref:DNA-3-methyladenine glycosylase II n=1 Tax=Nocardioides marmoriginsengisoli TaxID=661483 RepID=A0A3N0CNX3_9ACTN|nr:AlkA N-terminal domain-containing protein [Nocardioides marmoriginsengisoli]RNL65172.1 DNA-3-methyladenine glycosylase 2 family protein [Nocardioides marmoriginsengisoli]